MQIHSEFNEPDLGHGSTGTILHPIILVALVVAIVLMLWRPRKYVIVPLLLCIFLIPRGQVVVLAGLHLYIRLILVLGGFIRVVTGGFRFAGGLNNTDKFFMVWVTFRVFAGIVTNWPNGTMEQLYFLVQAVCAYALMRYLITDEEDIARAAKAFAVIAAILGGCMLYEYSYLINPFGALGGAPVVPEIRNGVGRAQATFGHSILAGCFGATLLPLFVWLWTAKSKFLASIGIAGSTLMVLTTTSSTPLLAFAGSVLGLMFWPFRRSLRLVRWAIVTAIVLLAIVMNAPVWFLISHIDAVGGSGGYDRAVLIDVCIRHFTDWWLIGTNQNGGWGYDMWDLSNQFVAEAEAGGLITFICFIAIIACSFRRIGKMKKSAEPHRQWLLWCLGCVMLANIFAFFGVAYWDQTQIWWFAFLAMISAATIPAQDLSLANAASTSATSKFAHYHESANAWRWSKVSTYNKSAD